MKLTETELLIWDLRQQVEVLRTANARLVAQLKRADDYDVNACACGDIECDGRCEAPTLPWAYRRRYMLGLTDESIMFTADNAEQVELWLGEAFNSHIPSMGMIEFTNCTGTLVAAGYGDTLQRCADGVHIGVTA